ncbi:hypothetical protein NQ315_005209 [Exocentrus adspersus]|uniref:Nuclear cap-binding protein subunit 3 n=1 Tax=Exocentrus adspersus TaxID=1586481 RepID=A0AAV8VTU3_9CUCU|nr:hypothetical protein NQ315_005209 [Exocentrus adspersus]
MVDNMENVRPNIRIEIHNNLTQTEAMEVDHPEEDLKSDNEEGEIVDETDTVQSKGVFGVFSPDVVARPWTNSKGIFTTGINIFDKEEQQKLYERAKRFSLKPDEIRNFTDADLEELHESLGITAENKKNVRFEAVHILGTNNLNAEDILEYFVKYAPTAVEWVSEDSCNVTWLEDISAARAMFYVSKAVRGMPAREPCDPFAKEFIDDLEEPEQEGSGQSILLKNKDRIVELEVEPQPEHEGTSKLNLKNAADISEISISVPPGYWRLGEKHPKAKCLLLRFAFKTDKQPYKTESFSKYYKNLGASKGIIPENKKREIRGIFDRNRELNKEKNPWGSLAKNWNRDVKFCEKERDFDDEVKVVEVTNPSIRVRLGTRRRSLDQENTENVEEGEVKQNKDIKRTKAPRMRMYADEEEEKLKRKKLLQTLKKQAEELSKEDDFNPRDLRNVLGITNHKRTFLKPQVTSPELTDLGTRLKNRTKNMVFTVESEVIDLDEECDRKENVQADIRSLIEQRRARSPLRRRRFSRERSSNHSEYKSKYLRRSRSPIRRRSPQHGRSPGRKRRHEGTLHSDKIEYERVHRHRHRLRNPYYSEDDEANNHKPKSKVAVVIKTQKKPTVASTIWSRVQPQSDESESDSDSESSSESDSSKSEEDSSSSESESADDSSSSSSSVKQVSRPGFRNASRLADKVDYRSPLKITMTNDRFKK